MSASTVAEIRAIRARWSRNGGMGNDRSDEDYTDAGCRILARAAFGDVAVLLAELDRLRAELAAAQKTIRAFVSGHADAQARIARGLALHHGVPDLSCPCGTLRCEACGEATPCSTVVALAEQGGQTP